MEFLTGISSSYGSSSSSQVLTRALFFDAYCGFAVKAYSLFLLFSFWGLIFLFFFVSGFDLSACMLIQVMLLLK